MMMAFGRSTPLSAAAIAAAIAATLAASLSLAHAGPCLKQICQMQVRINEQLDARAAAGPTARQSVGAMTSRQPTPRSIARAEEKLGDLSPERAEAIKQAMARARSADDAGDAGACEQALQDAERALTAHPAPR